MRQATKENVQAACPRGHASKDKPCKAPSLAHVGAPGHVCGARHRRAA